MKTININVHYMLSVCSLKEVEKHFGEAPGVESVRLNYALATATVHYNETHFAIANIRSAVRKRSYESFKLQGKAQTLVVEQPEEEDKNKTHLHAKTDNPKTAKKKSETTPTAAKRRKKMIRLMPVSPQQ